MWWAPAWQEWKWHWPSGTAGHAARSICWHEKIVWIHSSPKSFGWLESTSCTNQQRLLWQRTQSAWSAAEAALLIGLLLVACPCCKGSGRVRTTRQLQVIDQPQIFASGDCALIDNCPRPPSGVWAVRAAIPLARNLEAACQKQRYSLGHPSERRCNC